MPTTLAFEFYDNSIMLLVHRRDQPSDAEWDDYVAACERWFDREDPSRMRTLVITEGGGPTVDQRRRLNEMLAGRSARAAILSESIMIRGIVTAMSWWNPLIKSFRKHELEQVFAYLDLAPSRIPEILARLNLLRTSLALPPMPLPRAGPTIPGPTNST